MSKSQRVNFERNAKKLTTNPAVGPGKYDYSKGEIGKTGVFEGNQSNMTELAKESVMFKSQVERLAYMEPKIKTFIAGKLVKGIANRDKNTKTQDGEVTMIKEITPGPGDYFATNNLTSLTTDNKPNHLQFFGSTEERVPFYDLKKPKADINNDFRGPGTYDHDDINKQIPRQDKFHKGHSSSFLYGRERDLLFGGNPNPGPGEYRTLNGVNRLNGKVWSKICTFGTTEKRFQDKQSSIPGPGNYNLAKKPVKKKAINGYAFKSKTKRSLFGIVTELDTKDHQKVINFEEEQ